ncbi:MAG: cell division protein ZapD [Steroidobacteraceae bacterium]
MTESRPTVLYEHPLSERMRSLLRLEFLWQKLSEHSAMGGIWGMRGAVDALLEILAVTARGDTRGDVLKDLERQLGLLREYQDKPGVDPGRLRAVMTRLMRCREELNAAGGHYLQPLRHSEFLAGINHRSAIPGGTCAFDLPDFHHWLARPREALDAEFDQWVARVRPLCEAIGQLLWVTRENARPNRLVAAAGVHNVTFDREQPSQLLRLQLPAESDLFPQISGNHYRCSIRFLRWAGLDTRPVPPGEDVEFLLTSCT